MSCDEREITLSEVYERIKDLIQETTQDIKNQILDINSQFHEIKEKVNILENQERKNAEKIINLQRELRKNNLVIFGIAENEEEDLLNRVIEFFNVNLKIKVLISELNQVYRFGRTKGTRPILVKFVTLHKKLSVLKQGVLLKNTGISIANDLTKEDREEQKILRRHLKIARTENLDAKIIKNRLKIDDTFYTADQLETIGKQHNTNREDASQSSETLQNIPKKISNSNSSSSIDENTQDNNIVQIPKSSTQRRQVNKLNDPNIETKFSSYITRAKKTEAALKTKK